MKKSASYVMLSILCLFLLQLGSVHGAEVDVPIKLAIIAGFPTIEAVQAAQAFERRGYKIAKFGLSYGESPASQQRVSEKTVVKLLDLNNVYVAEASLRQYLEAERSQQYGDEVSAVLVNAFGVEDETLDYLADNLGVSLRNLNIPHRSDFAASGVRDQPQQSPTRDLDAEEAAFAPRQEAPRRGPAMPQNQQRVATPSPQQDTRSFSPSQQREIERAAHEEAWRARQYQQEEAWRAHRGKQEAWRTQQQRQKEQAWRVRQQQQLQQEEALRARQQLQRQQDENALRRRHPQYEVETPARTNHRRKSLDQMLDPFFQASQYPQRRRRSAKSWLDAFDFGFERDPFHRFANHFYANHPRFGIESQYGHGGFPERLGNDFYMPRGLWGF